MVSILIKHRNTNTQTDLEFAQKTTRCRVWLPPILQGVQETDAVWRSPHLQGLGCHTEGDSYRDQSLPGARFESRTQNYDRCNGKHLCQLSPKRNRRKIKYEYLYNGRWKPRVLVGPVLLCSYHGLKSSVRGERTHALPNGNSLLNSLCSLWK